MHELSSYGIDPWTSTVPDVKSDISVLLPCNTKSWFFFWVLYLWFLVLCTTFTFIRKPLSFILSTSKGNKHAVDFYQVCTGHNLLFKYFSKNFCSLSSKRCTASHFCIFTGNKAGARYERGQTYRSRLFTNEHGKQVPPKWSVPEMSSSYHLRMKASYLLLLNKETLRQRSMFNLLFAPPNGCR